jgi:hypothetical protein
MERTMLKAMNANHLSKPTKVALRTLDKLSSVIGVLLRRIKNVFQGFSTENWIVDGAQQKPKRERLLPLFD